MQFRVIQGGNDRPPNMDNIKFKEAYCTDTRLMGVFSVVIRWTAVESSTKTPEEFFQFFRIEVGTEGLETYTSMRGYNEKELERVEQILIKSLGGELRPLTYEEARALIKYHSETNFKNNYWPEGREEYNFILNQIDPVSPEDPVFISAESKTFTWLSSINAIIHYFVMRCFEHDAAGAKHLAGSEEVLPDFGSFPCGVLTKNTVIAIEPGLYQTTSLVETKNGYSMIIAEVGYDDRKVTRFRPVSIFEVSPTEAALQLAKPEFVTVYHCDLDHEDFAETALPIIAKSVPTSYEGGMLYMFYHAHNNHVDERVYLLSNDVKGMMYLSNEGELIAAANTKDGIEQMENEIASYRGLARHLIATAKFEFNEPIVYDYIISGFTDFEEFINEIKDPDGEE